MGNKFKMLVIGAMIVGIILGGFYLFILAEQKESRVNIVYYGGSSQGAAEDLPGMESVEVHGTISNLGDKGAKDVMVSVTFTDAAHDKTVKKTVVEGVDLPPNGAVSVEFDTEYLREATIPKTEVDIKIQIDWEEDGQLRTMTR